MENSQVTLKILDTNGSDFYRSSLKTHFKTANGIILMYDISDKNSFNNIYKWISDIKDYGNNQCNICKILVGNKFDSNSKEVTEEEGKKFAHENKMAFFEISVKENKNVGQIFNSFI